MQRHCFLSLVWNRAGQRVGIPGSAAMVTWVTALCGGSYPGFSGWPRERMFVKKKKKEQNVSTFEVASGGQNIGKRLIEWEETRELKRTPRNEKQGRMGRENLSTAWVNRAIWLSIIRDADDCRPVIEIPKANIDSSWSRRSLWLWHTPLLHYFLPLPSIQVRQMDYTGWETEREKKKKTSQNKMKVDSTELSRDERKYDRRRGRKTGGEGGRLIKGILGMSKSESHNQLT